VRLTRAPAEAAFAVIVEPDRMPALSDFNQGTAATPERSTTLVIQVPRLAGGVGRRLIGPGIDGDTRLEVGGLPARFWAELRANRRSYPCGVDVILTRRNRVVALPRSISVERH